ncbi:MAG: SDR family NAD(P)-dependent oxidoreductase [Gaiellales bacterium]
MKIAGAVVWVTGASSGIGEALVRELAHRGARVAATARRAEALHALAESTPGEVLEVPADVTDREAMAKAAVRVDELLGPIDLAMLNAGVWQQVDVHAFDSEVFRRHMETNLMGMVHGIEAVLPGMRKRRSGTIAGVASVAGYRGFPQSEAYGATKAAQINLLEALRIDLQPLGINVVTVCPGFVRTEATAVNAFPMPFMIDAPDAARRICDGLARDKAEIVFPVPMMLSMKALRLVPVRPYTWAFSLRRSQHTPRR